jgi:hypothetical protein
MATKNIQQEIGNTGEVVSKANSSKPQKQILRLKITTCFSIDEFLKQILLGQK